MRMIVSSGDGTLSFEERRPKFSVDEKSEYRIVALYPEVLHQRVAGFGAALTEASAWVFAHMPPALQDEVLLRSFAPASAGGNAYTLCRTHLQSCDFALGNYAYVQDAPTREERLASFSIDHDRSLLIPFIRCCLALQPDLELIAAPWSPAPYMKTRRRMNRGGRLRAEYYDEWAEVLACAVAAWREEGVKISRLTCQNEPLAIQLWDSCYYAAAEEAAFAPHLRCAFDRKGLEDVHLLAWDHNKDRMVQRIERVDAALKESGSTFDEVFAGTAFHWYTGDHFDAVRIARELHPDLELIHSEGCAAYSAGAGASTPKDAEHYAHDIIGDLNAGTNGWVDWNLLLDEQGGPNHVGNYCDAPLMFDRANECLIVNRTYDYLGHFSRYVEPGAHIAATTCYTDKLEALGAVNPDGGRVLVVLNRTARAKKLTVAEGSRKAPATIPAHAIATFIW